MSDQQHKGYQGEPIEDGLLARFLQGSASEQERLQVAGWIAASDENRLAFQQFERLWNQQQGSPRPSVDVDAAWSKMQQRMAASEHRTKVIPLQSEQPPQQGGHGRGVGRSWVLRIAAVLVVGLGVFAASRFFSNGQPDMITLATADTMQTFQLPDGSTVALNANSSLSYPEAWGNLRSVTLSGEAFFDVERNPEKPFVIQTDGAAVQVLGTSFNVVAWPDQAKVEVLVETGKVALFDTDDQMEDATLPASALMLEAGERGTFDKQSESTQKSDSFDPAAVYWRDRTLIFKRTRLPKVVEVLEELYDITIQYDAATMKNCRVNTTFTNEPIEVMMQVIAESILQEVESDGKVFTIKGNGC